MQILHIPMSSAKPLDVVILPKVLDDSAGGPGEPYQEFVEKVKTSGDDWSCYILAKEGEVSATSATVRPCTHAFPPSYSQSDARIQRTSPLPFGSPLTPATSNSTFSLRETR